MMLLSGYMEHRQNFQNTNGYMYEVMLDSEYYTLFYCKDTKKYIVAYNVKMITETTHTKCFMIYWDKGYYLDDNLLESIEFYKGKVGGMSND